MEHISPGPAAYAAVTNSKLKRTAPAYSLGARIEQNTIPRNPSRAKNHKKAEEPIAPETNNEEYNDETINELMPTPGPGHCKSKKKYIH